MAAGDGAQAFKSAADPAQPGNVRFFGSNANGQIWEHNATLFAAMPEIGTPAVGAPLQVGPVTGPRSRLARASLTQPSGRPFQAVGYNHFTMWTKMMGGPRKKAPKTIAVIDPDACFGAFACSICQAACPVAGCIVEEPDRDGRMVCAVRADLCIGCGLCVTLGNPTAPQQREFGCPADYDAINMVPFEEVVKLLQAQETVSATP